MTWRVRYTRTFLKEMAALPSQVRHRVEDIVFGDEIKQDPYLAGKVQKLVGYQDFYKIRIGDYRIGLRIDQGSRPSNSKECCIGGKSIASSLDISQGRPDRKPDFSAKPD